MLLFISGSVLHVPSRHAVSLYFVLRVLGMGRCMYARKTVDRGCDTLQMSDLPFNGDHPNVMRKVVM